MDFPSTPIIVDGAPDGAPAMFGAPGSGAATGGPCLLEPQVGALFPNNWLRPRFRVNAPAGQTLFEIRLHADNQVNDLVVYTANTSKLWTMPKDMWVALASHTRDMPITVTVRGASATGANVAKGTSGAFTIAPVGASGTMVYWSASGSTHGTPTNADTVLSGFAVGDESVVTVLKVGDAKNVPTTSTGDHCIGCHTSTPDGAYIAYNDFYPWGLVLASARPDATFGYAPDFMGVGGFKSMTQAWTGISSFSGGHWMTGDHTFVAPLGTTTNDTNQNPGLAWFNIEDMDSGTPAQLQNKGWGWLYKPTAAGDLGVAAPSFSHAGDFVVYTATSSVVSGRLGTGTADLNRVEFNDRAGSAPSPIAGAATTDSAEYYPALSHDDQLIAFNRIPAATAASTHMQLDGSANAWDGMYMQPATEIYVVPVAGGTPQRLDANSPPDCSGITSPGINNSWPKWSPEVQQANGRKYYWLIFSSWREGNKSSTGAPIAQLYVTGVVEDEQGMHSGAAIYLWNQPPDISNFTPAWDVFQIPTVQ
jgi:hypothetical protein